MNVDKQYVSGKTIHEQYGISNAILRCWANENKIDFVRTSEAGKRFYAIEDVRKVLQLKQRTETVPERILEKKRICYARVSSSHQKSSLDNQVEFFRKTFPTHDIITDIGSGLNWHRAGFVKLLDSTLSGNVQQVVVMHRDRLCRFAYELVDHIFKKTGTKLLVYGKGNESQPQPESERGFNELAEDLLAVTTFFTAQYNGRRSAEARKRKRDNQEQENTIVSDKGAEVNA